LVRRVLQNLVGNAVKFTPPGGNVMLSAELTTMISTQPIVLISVHDTGPGIPPEIQSQLFQKFVTGSQRGRGSGLGLAFCRLAVEAHGQQIWVDSSPGKGTTFTFSLAAALTGAS
jgi:signal transduction histidine kinase